jgi:hypothetical protein
LLRIKQSNDDFLLELEAFDASGDYHLFGMFKFEDRAYYAVEIPPGMRVNEFLKDDSGRSLSGTEYVPKMSFCFGPSSQGVSEKIPRAKFDGIKIESVEKPTCTLGPFQIVVFWGMQPNGLAR